MPQFKRVRLINPRKPKTRRAPRKTKARGPRMKRNASGRFVKRTRRNPFHKRPRRRTQRSRAVVRKAYRVSRPGVRARSKNPLGEELILLSNPRKKRNSHRSTSRSRRRTLSAARRRSNPFRSSHTQRRRRNPKFSREGVKHFAIEGVKAIAAGAVGAVGTRAIVQGILGDKNVGMMGYLSNLAVALGGGWLLFKFTKSKSIALGWAVGGAANTVQRIWSEKVSMTSPAAAAPQLSDLDYSSNGLGGVGLSGFVNTGFALPSVSDGNGVVQAPFQAQLPAVAAAAGSSSASLPPNAPAAVVSRYQPRYYS
jgi:hypothetical protein